MGGLKLSAKATETVEYLESLLRKADHLAAQVEQYAAAKKGADMYTSQLARELSRIRQKSMMVNLGFVADAAGSLSVAAGRTGSQPSKARTLRDGIAAFKQLVERTIKATIVADQAAKKEKAEQAEGR